MGSEVKTSRDPARIVTLGTIAEIFWPFATITFDHGSFVKPEKNKGTNLFSS